ncbi:zinc finger, CCHC-type containing protein [Tanacetum coccineum]
MAGNTVKEMTTNFGKLDKFEGHDFRRWQKKMHFLLTTLKVVYVLTTPMSELLEDATVEAIRIREKWENDDYICMGHILNGMSDSLFDVYTNVESAKELWDSLESKYMAEDSSSKKFLVSNFNNYKMVDSRPVMKQYNELLRILGQYTQHGLKMDESISVLSIIDKFPPSWKDFKHTLKHGKDYLSLVQLGSHLRIEESLRAQDSDKGKGKEVVGPSVNMAEEGKNKNNKQNKGKKRDFKEHGSGSGSNKKPMVIRRTQMLVVREKGLRIIPKTKVDVIAWWIDYGATTHNLVSGPMLNKCGYKQVYESDKYILSKSGVFVGFGYYNNGIIHETTALYTPQQNSVAERKNRALKEMINSMAIVRLPDPKRKTLSEKGIDCIFVGYNQEMQYLMRTISLQYLDQMMLYQIESQRDDHSDDVPIERSRDQVGSQYCYCYSIKEDPRTYNKAMQSCDAAFWKEAIDDEIGSIMKNNTWVLSDLPPG